jgi:hypothetical protein
MPCDRRERIQPLTLWHAGDWPRLERITGRPPWGSRLTVVRIGEAGHVYGEPDVERVALCRCPSGLTPSRAFSRCLEWPRAASGCLSATRTNRPGTECSLAAALRAAV